MNKQKKQIAQEDKVIKASTLAYAVAVVFMFAVGIASVLAYGTQTEIGAKIALSVAKVAPFPAAIVDWRHPVFLNDVQANLSSVEKFYQTQNFAGEGLRVDFTTESGKKRLMMKKRELLDKMVEDKIIEILAKQEGISISDKDVSNAVAGKLNEFGTTDDVKNDLVRSYGWSMDDFKKKVVLPGMYSDALAKKVLDQTSNNSGAKERITKAQGELENGKDFAEVARSYSQGSSASDGGELGWIKKEQVVPELQKVLFGTEQLKKNSIVESSIGFHIVEIENRKKENGQDLLQIRQIFVARGTFSDWVVEQKKKMSVWVPLSDFVWDAKTGSIDFKDEKMRVFEKEERAKAQGDASILL